METEEKDKITDETNFSMTTVRGKFNIFYHINSDIFGYQIDVFTPKGKLIAFFRQSYK